MVHLILLDGSSDITELISKIKQSDKTKIISFDILSHEELVKLGLEHEKVENYINENDQKLVETLSIEQSLNWYKQDGISNFLQYENMNLGCLLEIDLQVYLLKIMKSFVGIIEILKKEMPTFVTVSATLASMVKIIDVQNKITVNVLASKRIIAKEVNRVIIPINLGGKSFNVWIPLNLALRLARIVNSVASVFFNLKPNFKNSLDKGSILLVDFSPKQYGDLLHHLSTIGKETVLLSERGPPVWNLQNLLVVTNTKTKTIRLKDCLNSQLQSFITNSQEKLFDDFQKMLNSNKIKEFFSVCSYSFWDSIKENFSNMCIQVFNNAIKISILSKELLKNTNTKCVVTLYANYEERMISHIANELEIPAMRLQHSLEGPLKFMKKFWLQFYWLRESHLQYGVWGKMIKDDYLQLGLQNEKLLTIGSPRHDQFFKIKEKCGNNGTILITSSLLQNTFELSGNDSNISDEHKKMFRESCIISNKITGKKLAIKLHPSVVNSYDVETLLHEINPSILVYKTQNILDVLRDCDVVVCLDYSTVLLDAMILDKPTITIMVDYKWYENDEIIKSGATIAVKTGKEFEDALQRILFDKEFRNELIKKEQKFVSQYLANRGNASDFLAQILEKY